MNVVNYILYFFLSIFVLWTYGIIILTYVIIILDLETKTHYAKQKNA
jgi:hypothetical protein